jgi:CRP-like cAMP-binding protein
LPLALPDARKRGVAIRAAALVLPANHLLAALPRATYRRMLPKLEAMPFELGAMLYEAGTSPRYVYFPGNSMVSLIGMTPERDRLEVGLVGREGMVGCGLALGIKVSPTGALVQGAGSGMRMLASDFASNLERRPDFRREVLRCAGAQMATAMQIAACNNAHALQPRLARWLLMCRDRLGTTRFMMTQDFLAQMLGARRARVNVAAGALQHAKLITYSRGRITIRDLDGLRATACSCYEGIRRLTAR